MRAIIFAGNTTARYFVYTAITWYVRPVQLARTRTLKMLSLLLLLLISTEGGAVIVDGEHINRVFHPSTRCQNHARAVCKVSAVPSRSSIHYYCHRMNPQRSESSCVIECNVVNE